MLLDKTPTVLMDIPDGKEGIKQTLRVMHDLVLHGKKNITVREKALELTRYLKQKAFLDEVKALFSFVQNNIRYIRDIHTVETVHLPEKILEYGQGDCDDKSILLASMLESIGHPTRFVAAGFNGRPYSHVWVDTKIGTKWVSLDATDSKPMGWKPSRITSTLVIYN